MPLPSSWAWWSRTCRSTSQRATRRTPFILLRVLMWPAPWLRKPIWATRISPFEPAAWLHVRALKLNAAAPRAAVLRKLRRVKFIMVCYVVCVPIKGKRLPAQLLSCIRTWAQAELARATDDDRSEEHTSELQSLRHLVCRLLLEK